MRYSCLQKFLTLINLLHSLIVSQLTDIVNINDDTFFSLEYDILDFNCNYKHAVIHFFFSYRRIIFNINTEALSCLSVLLL